MYKYTRSDMTTESLEGCFNSLLAPTHDRVKPDL